jgi:hypothetical protein
VGERSMVVEEEIATELAITRKQNTRLLLKWDQLLLKEMLVTKFDVDVFCYEHGTEILNPSLSKHLAAFGINIQQQEKTEKSIAEMVIVY